MYTTLYSMEVRKIKNKSQYDKLVKYLQKNDLIGYAFDKCTYIDVTKEAVFSAYDWVNWNTRPIIMIMMSEKFPEMTFEITGYGESYGDVWKEYYHDGEVECCRGEIIYEQPRKIQWNELVTF